MTINVIFYYFKLNIYENIKYSVLNRYLLQLLNFFFFLIDFKQHQQQMSLVTESWDIYMNRYLQRWVYIKYYYYYYLIFISILIYVVCDVLYYKINYK